MLFVSRADDLAGSARAPEGRSHRDGQRALYLSGTPDGCIVATRRYMMPDDPPRALYPLRVENAQVADLRDAAQAEALGIDPSQRAIEWQSLRARGLHSPTWDIADRVRNAGLDGMLYASRTDPTMTHLTMFRWNEACTDATVEPDGPPLAFDATSA